MPSSISDIDRRIAGRIREFRKAAGLSMADLAGPLGVSHQQVQKYETYQDRVTVGQLQIIAEKVGVSPGRFFDDVTERPLTAAQAWEAQRVAARVALEAEERERASDALALAEAA